MHLRAAGKVGGSERRRFFWGEKIVVMVVVVVVAAVAAVAVAIVVVVVVDQRVFLLCSSGWINHSVLHRLLAQQLLVACDCYLFFPLLLVVLPPKQSHSALNGKDVLHGFS